MEFVEGGEKSFFFCYTWWNRTMQSPSLANLSLLLMQKPLFHLRLRWYWSWNMDFIVSLLVFDCSKCFTSPGSHRPFTYSDTGVRERKPSRAHSHTGDAASRIFCSSVSCTWKSGRDVYNKGMGRWDAFTAVKQAPRVEPLLVGLNGAFEIMCCLCTRRWRRLSFLEWDVSDRLSTLAACELESLATPPLLAPGPGSLPSVF